MRLVTWNRAYICRFKFLQLLLSFLMFWLVDKLWQPCWVNYESNGVYIERSVVQSNSLSRNNGHKGLLAWRWEGGEKPAMWLYPTHFTRPQHNKVKVNIITGLCVRIGEGAIIVIIAFVTTLTTVSTTSIVRLWISIYEAAHHDSFNRNWRRVSSGNYEWNCVPFNKSRMVSSSGV